jgi:Ca2+-binding RTX toxin-like protein
MTVSIIRGTHGDDSLGGTSGNDDLLLTQVVNNTVSGGDGDDIFRFGATLTAADHIDGGSDYRIDMTGHTGAIIAASFI